MEIIAAFKALPFVSKALITVGVFLICFVGALAIDYHHRQKMNEDVIDL